MKRPGLAIVAAGAALLTLAGASRAPSGAMARGWPLERDGRPLRIVFVSRNPLAGPGAVPGLGPRQRSAAPGGRLMVANGVDPPAELFARPPRPEGEDGLPYFDVSDPAVSPDGGKLVWAAIGHGGEGWRLRSCEVRGGDLVPRDSSPVPRAEVPWGYDDLDPCWLDDSTLVFASTREGWRSQYDGSPVTQLYRLDLGKGTLTRLTAERNGAEEPAADPRTGRIVYSRWWFNRARADTSAGDTVNVWQAISIARDGSDPHAVGIVRGERRRSSLYQPAVAADGSVLGVTGDALGLSPQPGACEVTWRARPDAPPVHVAGARFDPEDAPRYGGTRGLASPSACAPRPLPDGRVLFSLDPGARGDFGLWVAGRDGSDAQPLLDLPGSLELDAVAWPRAVPAPRPLVPAIVASQAVMEAPPDLARWPLRFRYLDRDVFGAGFGAREAAAARAAGPVRIRFWAALPRAGAPHGDTLVLVREAPVSPTGRVDERELPARVPLFEQLVGADGRVLRSAHGPAHVAGYNAGVPGRTASCVGCHRGHSTAR